MQMTSADVVLEGLRSAKEDALVRHAPDLAALCGIRVAGQLHQRVLRALPSLGSLSTFSAPPQYADHGLKYGSPGISLSPILLCCFTAKELLSRIAFISCSLAHSLHGARCSRISIAHLGNAHGLVAGLNLLSHQGSGGRYKHHLALQMTVREHHCTHHAEGPVGPSRDFWA